MITIDQSPKPVPLAPEPEKTPAYSVRELMQGGGQVQLVLDGVAYSLRITRAGKLILTK